MCGKVGHNAARCKFRKEDPLHSKPQANLTKLEIIVDVVSEVNLVSNLSEWVLDIGPLGISTPTETCLPNMRK